MYLGQRRTETESGVKGERVDEGRRGCRIRGRYDLDNEVRWESYRSQVPTELSRIKDKSGPKEFENRDNWRVRPVKEYAYGQDT